MNVKVFIEIGSDGTFGAYIPDKNPLLFGVIGEGETFERAKQDFLNVVDAYRADKVELPKNLNFVFRYLTILKSTTKVVTDVGQLD